MEARTDLRKGILCILLSALCYAAANTFVRLAGEIPAIQKTFFRSLVALAFSFLSLLRSRQRLLPERRHLPLLILRSAVGMAGLLLSYYAISRLALADATILGKTAPFFTILLSAVFLKESFTAKEGFLVLGAFIGALFVVKPSFENTLLTPALAGLLGGIMTGGAYAAVHALGKKGVSGSQIVFFFMAFSVITAFPLMLPVYTPMAPRQLLFLLLVGLFSTGGLFTVAAAYRYAAPSQISLYEYSEILLSEVLGFLVFSQLPDLWSALGCLIILSMAVMRFRMEKNPEKQ